MRCFLAESTERDEYTDDDDNDGEDEAMAAIREMQQAEEEEQARIEAEEKILQEQAIQIEKDAAQKEREEKSRLDKEKRKAAASGDSSSSSSSQFSPKSSVGLKFSSGGGDISEAHTNQVDQQETSQQSFGEFAAKVNEKKQQQMRPSSSSSSSGSSSSSSSSASMGMGSNRDTLNEIEDRLRQAQQQHYEDQQKQQRQGGQGIGINDSDETEEDHEMRLARYAVEYHFKRPVEKIIKAYEQKPIFDLYAIVGIEESADVTDVKFGYREIALLIHPDKNPHPKAKLAFDFLQEAYKILSSTEEREDYDKKLMKLRSTKLRLHKFKKKLENFYHNSKSKIQLLQYQGACSTHMIVLSYVLFKNILYNVFISSNIHYRHGYFERGYT